MKEAGEAIHRAIEGLKTLDKQDRLSFFARARQYAAIDDFKPWKMKPPYNECTTKVQFWVSLDKKPNTVANMIRIFKRFGETCEKHNLNVVPKRLQKALAVKTSSLQDELDLLSLCTPDVPYSDLLSVIAQAKGKPERSCNHSGEYEVWHKCKDCGHWEQSLSQLKDMP